MKSRVTRRSVLGAATAGVAAISLSACGGSEKSAGKNRPISEIKDQTVRVWFMEGSISDAAVAYLQDEFGKKFGGNGNKLVVENQPWDGIVSKLQTSLASKSESPDLVETGNTQSASFNSVGAFASLDDIYQELGGDKLIPSFVDAGVWEGKHYSLPLYAGARGVYYRKDLLEAAGLSLPSTLDEFAQMVIKLGKANPEGVPGFSGMYLAAVDTHAVESVMFAGGGAYAEKKGDKWEQKLSSPETVAALGRVQEIFKEGTAYALDSQASQKAFQKYFNENKVGVLLGTGNIGTRIEKKLWDEGKVGVMPLPGTEAGKPGQTFAGGSNISLASNAQNPELAREALKIIFSEGFQKKIAEDGWVPGNTTYSNEITGAFGKIAAEIVENSRLTPNTPQWGVAVGDNMVRDFFTEIAQGKSVQATAEAYGAKLEKILNSKK